MRGVSMKNGKKYLSWFSNTLTKFDGNIVGKAVNRDRQLFLVIWDQPRLSSSFHRKNIGVTMAVIVRYDDTHYITYVTHEKWPYQKLYDTFPGM